MNGSRSGFTIKEPIDYTRMLHVVPWVVSEIQSPGCGIHERLCPHREPMTKLIGGVLGVGDFGADFLVVLPPGPFLTFFRLASWNIGWCSSGGEGVSTYAVDDRPRAGKQMS